MNYFTGNVSFSNDSCISRVGKCDFYNEWEAIVSCRVPPVPIDSFIDEYYNTNTDLQLITLNLEVIDLIIGSGNEPSCTCTMLK